MDSDSPVFIDWLSQFLVMIDEGSVFRLLLLSVTMMWIGEKVAHGRLRAFQRGNIASVGAMMFYWTYGWFRFGGFTPGILLFIAWRGILMGGLTLGPAWMLFAVMDFVSEKWIQPIRWRVLQRRMEWRRTWQSMREERRQRQEQKAIDAEYEASREDRERAEQVEAAARQEVEESRKTFDRDLRRIRMELTLLYNKHRKELETRLPAADFAYLLEALSIEVSYADLRKRGKAIKTCMEDIVTVSGDSTTDRTRGSKLERIKQLADEADELQEGIARFDDETRETLESLLYESKTQKLSELLSE